MIKARVCPYLVHTGAWSYQGNPRHWKNLPWHPYSCHYPSGNSPNLSARSLSFVICVLIIFLVSPLVSRQIRSSLTETAERSAMSVFSTNLKRLLLSAPLRGKVVLAIDPGIKNGCKVAVVSPLGEPLHMDKIYLTDDQGRRRSAEKLAQWVKNFEWVPDPSLLSSVLLYPFTHFSRKVKGTIFFVTLYKLRRIIQNSFKIFRCGGNKPIATKQLQELSIVFSWQNYKKYDMTILTMHYGGSEPSLKIWSIGTYIGGVCLSEKLLWVSDGIGVTRNYL